MSIKHHPSRKFYDKPASAKTPRLKSANNLSSSEEQQFMQMLEHLVITASKEGSNNVALVVIAAMFFGFLVLALKPAQSIVNPPQSPFQSSPDITIITEQQQIQSQSYTLPEPNR